MSAMGSVIVIGPSWRCSRFLAVVSAGLSAADLRRAWRCGTEGWLPAALGDARQLAGVRHLAEAHAAEPELAVHRVRSPAPLAAGVAAHGELRLARGLVDKCLLGHGQDSLIATAIGRLQVATAIGWLQVATAIGRLQVATAIGRLQVATAIMTLGRGSRAAAAARDPRRRSWRS